jgi:acetyl-CoA carboxylase biotin carboxyl carrier protein
MMGTFYRSSSPGVPPFVEAGDIVTEHTIVGIIEVMKVMSSVEAGLRGRISSILAENGKLVQYNQPLFLIEPEDRSAETTHE